MVVVVVVVVVAVVAVVANNDRRTCLFQICSVFVARCLTCRAFEVGRLDCCLLVLGLAWACHGLLCKGSEVNQTRDVQDHIVFSREAFESVRVIKDKRDISRAQV